MLTNTQLKRMIKHLTDRQVCSDRMAEREHKDDKGRVLWTYNEILAGDQAWGHTALIFFEAPPATNGWASTRENSAAILESYRKELEDAQMSPCFPVFMGETEGDQFLVRFRTRDGAEYLANGRYIATIVHKQRKQAQALTWHVIPGRVPALVAELTEPVAVLATLNDPVEPPAWRWTLQNNDLPQTRPAPRPATGPASLPQLSLGF